MLILRDLTDGIYDFESLVRNTDNQDHIDDCRNELLEDVGNYFYSDGGMLRREVIKDVQVRARHLEVRVVRGQVTFIIEDDIDEDGELIPRRVSVPMPN
ncbi:hypothetical protein [Rhodanobacter soli]|uniref:hypothetical protein n=1 Tax=Rhodanobacter soli TaxID=590609 RepID=UPI0031E48ACF